MTADEHRETHAEAAAACLARELSGLGADAGYVATRAREGDVIEVARVTAWSATPVRLTFPVDAPYPLAETLRTGLPLFIGDNEELVCSHPGLIRVVSDDHACATVPLRDRSGDVLGAINLAFEDPHPFTDAEREQIEAIARSCADALAGDG